MSDSASELRSRRALLTGGFAGLAALVANAILRPLPAAAVGTPVYRGEFNDAGAAGTFLNSSNSATTLSAQNSGSGHGLQAVSNEATGVFAVGSTEGVLAVADGTGRAAVRGLKNGSTGPAVKGENVYAANGYAAVYGVTNGTGPAVYGEGLAAGNGTSGVAKGTGSGVYGQSDNGRGGRFKGKKAQIRLDPATTTPHPASGDAGDLYLDKSKRLWLCKGGTTWVRMLTS